MAVRLIIASMNIQLVSLFLFGVVFLLNPEPALLAQNSVPSSPNPPTPAPRAEVEWKELNAALVAHTQALAQLERDFQTSLRAENEAHRKFWEGWLEKLLWALGLLGAAFGGFVSWVGIRKIQDLERHIDAYVEKRFAETITAAVNRVDAEFSRTEAKLKERSQKLETAVDGRMDDLEYLVSAISFAVVALRFDPTKRKYDAERNRAIYELEICQQKFPCNRRVTIYLGRFYQDLGQLEIARKVLLAGIATREKANREKYSTDIAALWYNRACYGNFLARTAAEPNAERLREEAWTDLRQCIAMDPANLAEALRDEDLKDLEKEPSRKFSDLAPRA